MSGLALPVCGNAASQPHAFAASQASAVSGGAGAASRSGAGQPPHLRGFGGPPTAADAESVAYWPPTRGGDQRGWRRLGLGRLHPHDAAGGIPSSRPTAGAGHRAGSQERSGRAGSVLRRRRPGMPSARPVSLVVRKCTNLDGPGLFSADDGLECRVLGRSASLSGSAPTWMDPRAGETTEGRRHDGTRLASLRCVCQVRVSGGAWYFTGTRGRGRRLGARKSSALLRRPERRQLRVGPKEPVIWWNARQRAGELSEAPAVGPSQLKTGKEMDINA